VGVETEGQGGDGGLPSRRARQGRGARPARSALVLAGVIIAVAAAGAGLGLLALRTLGSRFGLAPVAGATFTELSAAEPAGLNPLVFEDDLSRRVSALFLGGLTRVNGAGEALPDLATAWTPELDGRVWTFELRRGVRWHDGRTFSAADVVFTYDSLTGADFPGSLYNRWQGIQVLQLDDFVVKFVLPAPNPFFPLETATPILPRHRLSGVPPYKWATHETARAPVGTGPFKFAAWTDGKEIVAEANAAYHLGSPALARFVFKVTPDPAVALARGEGQAAMVPAAAAGAGGQGDRAARRRLKVFTWAAPDYAFLALNAGAGAGAGAFFNDVRVRRAVAHAINRTKAAEAASTVLVDSPFPPGWWAHNPALKAPKYDPGRARELLAQAGWKDLAVTLTVIRGRDADARAAVSIAGDLAAVGIRAGVKTEDFSDAIAKMAPPFAFDGLLAHWPLDPNPDVQDLFSSTAVPSAGAYGVIRGGANFVRLKSAEVDRLLTEAASGASADPAKAREAYHRLEQAIVDAQPYVFLWAPALHYAVSSRVVGPAPGPWGIYHNVHEWKIVR
jgi:peptide/nickel transport system substrate-binding protein